MTTSATPHLCNPIRYCMFLLGLENMSKRTSRHSVLSLVHQRLAEMFRLKSFLLMTKDSSGSDLPIYQRRVRSVAPAKLQKQEKCACGIVDNVLRRIVQDVQCIQGGSIEVVRGVSMRDLKCIGAFILWCARACPILR
jgi:hypothetical protein